MIKNPFGGNPLYARETKKKSIFGALPFVSLIRRPGGKGVIFYSFWGRLCPRFGCFPVSSPDRAANSCFPAPLPVVHAAAGPEDSSPSLPVCHASLLPLSLPALSISLFQQFILLINRGLI